MKHFLFTFLTLIFALSLSAQTPKASPLTASSTTAAQSDKSQTNIVFCATKKEAKKTAKKLAKHGLK